jgi:hypothetical protein
MSAVEPDDFGPLVGMSAGTASVLSKGKVAGG